MTNNEHNEAVLAKISALMAEIDELKKDIKPIELEQGVSLAECNAGAREQHFAKYAQQAAIKAAVELAVMQKLAQMPVAEVYQEEGEGKDNVKTKRAARRAERKAERDYDESDE